MKIKTHKTECILLILMLHGIWKSLLMANRKLENYETKDAFNIDETGLLVKNIENKSYALQKFVVKIEKTRLTFM